jgi:carboxypeptidase D
MPRFEHLILAVHYFLENFFLFHGDKFLKPVDNDSSAKMILRRPFYFSGESHAGHYIPSMMDYILQRNDGNIEPTDTNGLHPLRVNIPISGAAIGNGWIDPYHQYASAGAAYGAGIIGTAQRASYDEKERECQSNLKSGNFFSGVCFDLLDDIVDQSSGKSGHTRVSQYDTRLWENKGQPRSFPFGHKEVETYLGGAYSGTSPPLQVNYRDVLAAIHATEAIQAGQTYQECTDPPYIALQHQDGMGVVDELVRILDHESKPHMLFFNGINDLICNHVGNEQLLDVLPWSKAMEYSQQPRYAWESGVDGSEKVNYIPGRPDGYIKQFENMSFLKILESGHMVPMDQPAIALVMMKTLVYGTGGSNSGFLSSMQDLSRADPSIDARMCSLDECPNCLPPVTVVEEALSTNAMASTVTLSNLGISLAAFVSGIICTYLCQRRQRANETKLILTSLEDDMELTDQDSVYRDTPGDRAFT